ncbi:hypothetical protein [Falsibacillus albus]|uniref:Uncharacterized protein n=1 Tax=Falsibacillus albus TaxID=2478915 RepID=A0A3L7JRM6_9BACI|nr:hypothetical protein [Falsibacillus albus]RLQ93507.1 hypothetical protein D9X91_17565 [Falsibacillus albus]
MGTSLEVMEKVRFVLELSLEVMEKSKLVMDKYGFVMESSTKAMESLSNGSATTQSSINLSISDGGESKIPIKN